MITVTYLHHLEGIDMVQWSCKDWANRVGSCLCHKLLWSRVHEGMKRLFVGVGWLGFSVRSNKQKTCKYWYDLNTKGLTECVVWIIVSLLYFIGTTIFGLLLVPLLEGLFYNCYWYGRLISSLVYTATRRLTLTRQSNVYEMVDKKILLLFTSVRSTLMNME